MALVGQHGLCRELGRGVVLAEEVAAGAELGLQAAVLGGCGVLQEEVLLVVGDLRRDVERETGVPVGHLLQVVPDTLRPLTQKVLWTSGGMRTVRSDPATLSSAAALASSARARPPTARRMKMISARWLSRSAVKIRNCMAQPRKKR
jgi:hypothetical protein